MFPKCTVRFAGVEQVKVYTDTSVTGVEQVKVYTDTSSGVTDQGCLITNASINNTVPALSNSFKQ